MWGLLAAGLGLGAILLLLALNKRGMPLAVAVLAVAVLACVLFVEALTGRRGWQRQAW